MQWIKEIFIAEQYIEFTIFLMSRKFYRILFYDLYCRQLIYEINL